MLDQQIRSLMSMPSTPHLVHGWGDASNTPEYLLAAFLIVVQPHWYISLSGWDGAMDRRFNSSAAGNDGQWGEHSFPYLELFSRPLGAPRGDAVKSASRVWTRSFEHVDVTLHVDCHEVPRNCSTLSWRSPAAAAAAAV